MNKEKYIMTLDEGTSSCRTLIVNKKGEVVSSHQIPITQNIPTGVGISGWVEHDAIEIWNSQLTTMIQSMNKHDITPSQIEAIGITNQRETTVVWNRETGLPLYNAIVWQDRRTTAYCQELIKQEGLKEMIHEKTGLLVDSYFSATKIKWILDNVAHARELADQGRLAFGTIDSWLIYKLTSNGDSTKAIHVTDITNASRTMLFNINTQKWDEELLELFGIPASMLPEVKSNSEVMGMSSGNLLSKVDHHQIPIASAIGDQQSALFGQLCINPGEIKNTYGTGCFIIMNIGDKPTYSTQGLLTTIGYKIGKEDTIYALEGSVFTAGAAMKYLQDQWKIMYHVGETSIYTDLVSEESAPIYFVPAFVGLGAPYWDSEARGAIFGLEYSTKREHIIKAALESLAFQSQDVILAMKKDVINNSKGMKKVSIKLKVDGGAAKNDYLMQFQSNISQIEVIRPVNIETTALGAAYLAGLAVGFWKSVEELQDIYRIEKQYIPTIAAETADHKYKWWLEAVKRSLGWKAAIA